MVSLLDKRPERSPLDRPKTVSVNGVVISRARIAREMQNHTAEKPAEAWTEAARALAIRELLLQEARRQQLEANPQCDAEGRRETDEEALVRTLVEHEVKTPQPGDTECRRYFDANRMRFRSPSLYEVRHILVAAAPRDPTARATAKAATQALVAELESAPEKFADLAASRSACPSATIGGILGQIGPGQTVPEFEAALATAPVGKVAPAPVETRYGYHVVLVDRRIDGKDLPFDLVKERIANWLSERVQRVAIRQYIAWLAAQSRIEGVELAASASPLMQ